MFGNETTARIKKCVKTQIIAQIEKEQSHVYAILFDQKNKDKITSVRGEA